MASARRLSVSFAALALVVAALLTSAPARPAAGKHHGSIKHVIVIFQENRSFDHYFGTYPFAEGFIARAGTPIPDNLLGYPSSDRYQHNLLPLRRITDDRTLDLPHDQATMVAEYNQGRMDQFVQRQKTGATRELVMSYYDYASVPHYWHYAQRYALADHYFSSVMGSSTPAALFVASAQSHVDGNPFPEGDICNEKGKPTVPQRDADDIPNVGTALSAAGVTWGWYQGGFAECPDPENLGYDAHHNPFQYFTETADLEHAGAKNQHDLDDFYAALRDGTLPQVAYLKADRRRNEHPGYSSISGGRDFVVRTLNAIMESDAWESTVVILTFDESGGWYDHVPPPQVVLEGRERGLAPRVPTLVISPFARSNYISHQIFDHASVVRFIEETFVGPHAHLNARDQAANDLSDMLDLGQRNAALILDPDTGKPAGTAKRGR